MKHIILINFCVIFTLVLCRPDEKYTTKYDNIDLDEILKSDRLLNKYFDCVMTGESCTKEGMELRNAIPDAIETGCSKCSRKQKDGTKKVIQYLMKNKQDKWKQLEAKYDPQGTYKRKYKDELEKEGIIV